METERNRYAPPRSNLVEAVDPQSPTVFAGKGRRFGTLIVDYLGFFIGAFLTGVLVEILFGRRGVEALRSVPHLLLGLIMIFAYYVFFEGLWARTPGKLAFGTIVVSESGRKPSLRQVVLRTLCRCIPFEAFSFFGELGWHDSLSHTRVIRKKGRRNLAIDRG